MWDTFKWDTSLPLMGIGNLAQALWDNVLLVDSLPLMGIGNTTCLSSTTTHSCDSLPLMGIGNLVEHFHVPPLEALITPHGDRELYRE